MTKEIKKIIRDWLVVEYWWFLNRSTFWDTHHKNNKIEFFSPTFKQEWAVTSYSKRGLKKQEKFWNHRRKVKMDFVYGKVLEKER